MQTASIFIRNANIVLPDRIVFGSGLLVENGMIVGVTGEDIRTADRTIDGTGITLYPGFIDVHNHGVDGIDTMEADADGLRRAGRFLAAQGVTGWLPTLVPAPDEEYRRAAAVISETMHDAAGTGARALGVHYEGPFINSLQSGALRPPFFKTFAGESDLDRLASLDHPEAVYFTTLAPEIDGGIDLVRTLTRRGWVVSIGHTRADVVTLDRAREAGARHMTHFFNAMTPMHHRTPGPVGWGLLRDDVTCDVIADGHHCDPHMLRLLVHCKTAERVSLISDSIAPTGLGDGTYEIWGECIRVIGGKTENERGSIAGSVITMRDAARMMLGLGFNPIQVARMAATNPARLLRLDATRGSIEPGKIADVTALDDTGNVCLTLVGGNVAFQANS